MSPMPPWTDIGSLQSDVADLQSKLHGKADEHSVHDLEGRCERIETALRELKGELERNQTEQYNTSQAQQIALEAIEQRLCEVERVTPEAIAVLHDQINRLETELRCR